MAKLVDDWLIKNNGDIVHLCAGDEDGFNMSLKEQNRKGFWPIVKSEEGDESVCFACKKKVPDHVLIYGN